MVNGPYKSEWDTMVARADGFVSSPPAKWTARTSGGCWVNNGSDTTPGRTLDRELRDAGLMWLLTENTNYFDAVLARLLDQATVAGTNFGTNTSVWCSTNQFSTRDFEIGNWLRRLLYAYDYIRLNVGSSDKTTLDNWFTSAGTYVATAMNSWITTRVAGRMSDDYTCTAYCTEGQHYGLLCYGGPYALHFSACWDDVPSTGAAFLGALGIMLDNATFKDAAKRYFTEWMKYAVYPGGRIFDEFRWGDTGLQETAIEYLGSTLGSLITLADHFARAGDSSLYDFSTEDGFLTTVSAGNPKTFLQVCQRFAGMINGDVIDYASSTSTSDPAKIIDGVGTTTWITWINLSPASMYYRDSGIQTAAQKTVPGSYDNGGYDMLGGDWGSYSTIRGMFGEMENDSANPYL